MDFLRRLAPVRGNDTTQAVAVLPSRFANAGPLAVILAGSARAGHADPDPASFGADTASAHARVTPGRDEPHATRRADADDGTPIHVSGARPPGADASQTQPPAHSESPFSRGVSDRLAPRRVDGLAPSSRHAGTGAPDLDGFEARVPVRDRHGAEHAASADGEVQGATAARGIRRRQHAVAASLNASHAAAPLSEASLAHRRPQAADDNQVVHVTIGRIDVVAVSTPSPAVRRAAVPRPGTATLADYLRGANGGRR